MTHDTTETVEAYDRLLNEGTDVIRPIQLTNLNGGRFKILPMPDHDPTDEEWEYLPMSIVALKESFVTDGRVLFVSGLFEQD